LRFEKIASGIEKVSGSTVSILDSQVPQGVETMEPAPENPSPPSPSEPSPIDQIKANDLEARITEALRLVYDPEIPVNIYDLGLIYKIDADPTGNVAIDMTLTSPACPVAGTLPGEVEQRVRSVDGVSSAKVEVVWDPPWGPDRMSEAAKLELGFM
jgi:FeS assembly SUF system protein